MPKFDIVLRLDEHEKDQLRGACDPKTFAAAFKAHEALAKEEAKTLSVLLRDKLTSDDFELTQQTLPALRKLVEPLADSEEKAHALEEIGKAEETLQAIARAQESLIELQHAAGGNS